MFSLKPVILVQFNLKKIKLKQIARDAFPFQQLSNYIEMGGRISQK